ncbi:hypothetical protein HZC00_01445 [Candidatus Kaiserbacteria bacterium]|nr:hypothetical protein [Candidatus Kaiserbacteria bacterium]
MSNRKKTDFKKGEVATTRQVITRITEPCMSKAEVESLMRSAGIPLWSSQTQIDKHEQIELRRERWRFGLQWALYALALGVFFGTWAWLVPDPSLIGAGLSCGVMYAFAAWLCYTEQVVWRTSEDVRLYAGMYYRDGCHVALPDKIVDIARRIVDLLPASVDPHYKVGSVGSDPELRCYVFGHCIVAAVWYELSDGAIKILKEPTY